jgi:transcriptional regulator GlxA family with amidase domain
VIAVSLLLFEEVVPSSVTGVMDLLDGANQYLQQAGQPPAFRLELVSEEPIHSPLTFPTRLLPTEGTDRLTDLIIVPSFPVGNDTVVINHQASIRWLKRMHERGAEVASLCVGCYLLAEAGLLEGREATSHWAVIDEMQKRYPRIRMKSDRVITDQQGIYTSGGAFSSLKLILYLIEKFCGRPAALWVSKMYGLDLDRTSQAHFAVLVGQHQHQDQEILQAQRYLETHYQEVVSLETLSGLVHLGKRTFIRRFKAATNNTPLEYLQRVRIESAKKAIENNDKDLMAIADESGYRDLKTFRSLFKRLTGLSPQAYRRKYGRS